jgi:hypothetical protein
VPGSTAYVHETPHFQYISSWFQEFTEEIARLHHTRWLHQKNAAIEPASWKILLRGMQETQAILAKALDVQQGHSQEVQRLISVASQQQTTRPSAADFEFFRGSTGWHIRFNGNLVKAGKNNKGFRCIHKLLLNPGRKFYPNELDPISENTESERFIQVSDSFAVEVGSFYSKINLDDEQSLEKALRQLGTEPPDEHDSMEAHIYHLSNMLYLADCLKNIRSISRYITVYNTVKEQLDDRIFRLQKEHDDSIFVDRVLSKSKIIRKQEKALQSVSKKMRERVSKNIQNAIASMDHQAAKEYFETRLTIGMQSVFRPDATNAVSWKLQIDD